ncbi:MAG TPA: hypothetical protein VKM72_33230 [Thermoanaerobaculia bacterium]|nr:hypothetical protein [Thermoanaerobaculia bacterium]
MVRTYAVPGCRGSAATAVLSWKKAGVRLIAAMPGASQVRPPSGLETTITALAASMPSAG